METNVPNIVSKLTPLPQNHILNDTNRKMKIRYCWLLYQKKCGIIKDSEARFFTYLNLMEIAKLLKTNEKIYSHFNHENQCLSLKNICSILYQNLKDYYLERIAYFKDSKKYSEVRHFYEKSFYLHI